MRIAAVETYLLNTPLIRPFITAKRTVHSVQSLIVKVTVENGMAGFGEAVPVHVITGETAASIRYAIENVLAPAIIGVPVTEHAALAERMNDSLVANQSAKAALDMAFYDLLGHAADMPLYQLLGGARSTLKTSVTVSIGTPEEMAEEAARYVKDGFTVLKIKIGTGKAAEELARVRAVRQAVHPQTAIRLDANQGWAPKEAVRIIRKLEEEDLGIEFIEQPVRAADLAGLRHVTNQTAVPIMADESLFSVRDAVQLLEMRAVDLFNIKLMKSGGIREALKINALAEAYGVRCMAGCMMESAVGITAAAHLAASHPNIVYADVDAPVLSQGTFSGGIGYSGSMVRLKAGPGLGFNRKEMDYWIKERVCE